MRKASDRSVLLEGLLKRKKSRILTVWHILQAPLKCSFRNVK